MTVTFPSPNPRTNDANDLRVMSTAIREALKGNIIFQGILQTVPVNITNTNSPYTATAKSVILADDSAGNITINLPPAEKANGYIYIIKKADGGTTYSVTIDASGSETIDGATTKVLSSAWESVRIVCNGTEWFTI